MNAIPDSKPGPYYVSVVDAGRYALVSGPYEQHAEALEKVDPARRICAELNPRTVFYAFGTCRLEEPANAPRGKLQEWGYDLNLIKEAA
jgi:hypothetical protein